MGWAELQCGGKMASSRGPVLDVSPLNAMRVLAVEDAWHVAKAMKGALERLGIHVVGPTAATAGARRPSSGSTVVECGALFGGEHALHLRSVV